MDRGVGQSRRIGPRHGGAKLRRPWCHIDVVGPRLALLQQLGLVHHQQPLTVLPQAVDGRKAPALMRARQVMRGAAERIARRRRAQHRLRRGHVRLVGEAIGSRRRQRQRIPEGPIGEELLRQAQEPVDDRRCARSTAKGRHVIRRRVTQGPHQVAAGHIVVVGAQVGLDATIARRPDARWRSRLGKPVVVSGLCSAMVPDAADGDHVLGPGLRARQLRADVRLTLGRRQVEVEEHVVELGRNRVVVERRGIAPARGCLHHLPRQGGIDCRRGDLIARIGAPGEHRRFDDLSVR